MVVRAPCLISWLAALLFLEDSVDKIAFLPFHDNWSGWRDLPIERILVRYENWTNCGVYQFVVSAVSRSIEFLDVAWLNMLLEVRLRAVKGTISRVLISSVGPGRRWAVFIRIWVWYLVWRAIVCLGRAFALKVDGIAHHHSVGPRRCPILYRHGEIHRKHFGFAALENVGG